MDTQKTAMQKLIDYMEANYHLTEESRLEFKKALEDELEQKSASSQTAVMPRFNMNNEVIIYPNEIGFAKIKALISNKYLLSSQEANNWIKKRKTEDGGYQDQLWVIVSDLHHIFYNGQNFIDTTIAILNEA